MTPTSGGIATGSTASRARTLLPGNSQCVKANASSVPTTAESATLASDTPTELRTASIAAAFEGSNSARQRSHAPPPSAERLLSSSAASGVTTYPP